MITILKNPRTRHEREYNILRTSFEEENLKKKLRDPVVIRSVHAWMRSNDDYHKKKRAYEANKTSEGWELYTKAEWYRVFSREKVHLLISGMPRPLERYDEWIKKRPFQRTSLELPDDVLSIIRAYSRPVFQWYKEYNEAKYIFEGQYSNKDLIKLKEKWDDPAIREQVKTCIDAYKQGEEAYQIGCYCKEHWWFSVSIEKLDALLYDKEYRMLSYAEWVFKDEIDDAWADSDISWDDEAGLALQEQWLMEEEEELF